MHEFGVSLVWLSLQVTIVAVVATLLYRLVRRWGPKLRSLVVSSAMLVTLLLTPFAFSPWPRWSADKTTEPQTEIVTESPVIAESGGQGANVTPANPPPFAVNAVNSGSVWKAAWDGFQKGLEKPQHVANTQMKEPLTWPSTMGLLFVTGVTLGILRLCIGFILLRREVQLSTSLQNSEARELLDSLLIRQPQRATIRLQETERLTTAAVVGWWRPTILLPRSWQAWSAEQLQAVLTHELAHIEQGDFLSNFCAEISRAVHFYHPLMHWLAVRLRLEQELAADAVAAKSSGGPEPYLIILAEMAMEKSNRSIHWPARAFLPTDTTFLRRIDMLKNKTQFTQTLSRTTRTITIAAVMLAGIVAAGFRGNHTAVADDAAPVVATSNDTTQTEEKPEKKIEILEMLSREILSNQQALESLVADYNFIDCFRFSAKVPQVKNGIKIPFNRLDVNAFVIEKINSSTDKTDGYWSITRGLSHVKLNQDKSQLHVLHEPRQPLVFIARGDKEAYQWPTFGDTKRWIFTPEYSLFFEPGHSHGQLREHPYSSLGSVGGRIAYLRRAGAGHTYGNVFNPRDFLSNGSNTFQENCQSYSESLRGNHSDFAQKHVIKNVDITKIDTGHSIQYVMTTRFPKYGSHSITVFDSSVGFNAIKYSQFSDKGLIQQREISFLKTKSGIFIPSKYRLVRFQIRPDKTKAATVIRVANLRQDGLQVNTDIDKSVFTIKALGLRYGERILNEIENHLLIYSGRDGLIPVEKFVLNRSRLGLE